MENKILQHKYNQEKYRKLKVPLVWGDLLLKNLQLWSKLLKVHFFGERGAPKSTRKYPHFCSSILSCLPLLFTLAIKFGSSPNYCKLAFPGILASTRWDTEQGFRDHGIEAKFEMLSEEVMCKRVKLKAQDTID